MAETLPQPEINPFIIDSFNRKIRNIVTAKPNVTSYPFLKLSEDFLISGVLECDATVTTVAGDVGETTLATYTIPLSTISRNYGGTGTSGKDFRKAGNTFRIIARGTYTTDDASATVAIALKIGSTTYHTITTTGATVTNAPWNIDWIVIVPTVGAAGTAESQCVAKTNNVNKDSANTATISLDTTVAEAISLTATWASGSAGDNIKIRQFLVELLN